ncbi:hypothetical protein MTO96_013939 [Rhipicephalus appendiculatus]
MPPFSSDRRSDKRPGKYQENERIKGKAKQTRAGKAPFLSRLGGSDRAILPVAAACDCGDCRGNGAKRTDAESIRPGETLALQDDKARARASDYEIPFLRSVYTQFSDRSRLRE